MHCVVYLRETMFYVQHSIGRRMRENF